mgnify:CR=1 FL=1|tara:strand:- start:23605 stop:24210 length:606 start_codon:yes stop_codon:yes gene_type:complete
MTNKEAIQLMNAFKDYNDETAFVILWENTHLMVKPYQYFDPSGARNQEDFLQITRIGLWQALNSFKEGTKSTLLSWIRMRMTQLLIKEIRKMVREPGYCKVSLDDLDNHNEGDSRTIEEKFFEKFSHSNQFFDEDKYYSIISRAEENLQQNRLVLKAFQIKMIFPDMKRKTLAKLLGVTKASVGKYFETIRTELQYQEDAF